MPSSLFLSGRFATIVCSMICMVVVLIPEEILSLSFLLAWRLCAEYGLQRVRIIACIPGLSADSHGCRREVLNLFKLKAEFTGDAGQLRHILLMTAGMAGDEVGDNLLVEVLLTADAVEDALKVVELLERGLTHQVKHTVAGVFRCNLQTATDMTDNELAGVFTSGLVGGFILAMIE